MRKWNTFDRSSDARNGFTCADFQKEIYIPKLENYDAELFAKIKEFRINRIKEFTGKIVGYDIDARMLNAARINIEAAEMEDVIEVKNKFL